MDESIRIPKTRSIVPWLALLLIGGVGFAMWHYTPSELRLVALKWMGALKERVTSTLIPNASGVASPESAPSTSDRTAGALHMGLEAGAPRVPSATPPRPWAAPSAPSTHRPIPTRRDAGSEPGAARTR